jgi:uncharacterized membrane protein
VKWLVGHWLILRLTVLLRPLILIPFCCCEGGGGEGGGEDMVTICSHITIKPLIAITLTKIITSCTQIYTAVHHKNNLENFQLNRYLKNVLQ